LKSGRLKFGAFAPVLAIAIFAGPSFAQSGPAALNIGGGLFDATGSPIVNPSVNFKIEIYDKTGSCRLYSETHLGQDLSGTKGSFSLELGEGSGVDNAADPASPTALSSKVFENSGTIAGGWAGCPAGATLADGDNRVIRVQYDLGGGYVAMSPDVPIEAAAYSIVAETLQGKRPSDFIQVHDDVSNKLTQANVENIFSATNYPKLTDLLSGASSSYISSNPTSAVSFNNQLLTNVASPVAGTDATNKDYVDGSIGGKTADLSGVGPATGDGYTLIWDESAGKWTTGVPSATDNTKLPLAGGTMTGTIDFAASIGTGIDLNGNDLSNTGHIVMSPLKTLTLGTFTSAQETTLIGTLTAANAGASWYNSSTNAFKIWDGSTAISQTFTGAAAGGDLTGTYPNPIIANDKITSAKVDSAGVDRNLLVISDQVTGAALKFATCSTNEVLRYEDVNGWVCRDPSSIVSFPVTSVNGHDGTVNLTPADLGLGTAALENVGTAAGEIPQLDAGGKIPASMIPAASSPTWGNIVNGAGKYMTYKPNNVACGNGEVLKFDGTNWVCADISTLGTGDFMKDGSVAMTGNFNAGGNSILGDVTASANLTLESTSDSTKGFVNIQPNGGNVGIGTATPSAPLHVNGNVIAGQINSGNIYAGNLVQSSNSTGSSYLAAKGSSADAYTYSELDLQNTSDSKQWSLIYRNGSTTPADAQKLQFNYYDGSSYHDFMTLTPSGNVGIGTTAPGSSLEVYKTVPTGTISSASTAVTGAGTNFTSVFSVGDRIVAGAEVKTVTAITNNTSLTVDSAFATSLSAASYARVGSVLNAGNVGIGTTSPGSALDVSGRIHGHGTFGHVLEREDSSSTTYLNTLVLRKTNNAGVGAAGTGTGLLFKAEGSSESVYETLGQIGARATDATSGSASGYLTFYTANTGSLYERMRIDKDGKVGIGTTSPQSKLDVNGSVKVGADASGCSGALLGAIHLNGTALEYCDGTDWKAISATGGAVGAGAGSASSPSMTFSGDTDTGFYDASSNDTIGVAAGGTSIFNFSSSGLVSPTTGGAAITTSNGTASAPTYSFAGDTGTGWFRPATSTLAASTGGTERIRIDQNGNIGIGTMNPVGKLQVNTGTDQNLQIISSLATGSGTALNSVNDANSTNVPLEFNASSYGFRIGKVGIGTTSPQNPLHVIGVSNAAGIKVETTDVDSDAVLAIKNDARSWQIRANGSDGDKFSIVDVDAPATRFVIDTAGHVGIGTSSPGSKLQIDHIGNSTPLTLGDSATISSNTGIYLRTTGEAILQRANGGTFVFQDASLNKHMVINGAGKVGIGTTSPAYPLTVSGDQNSALGLAVNNPNTGAAAESNIYIGTDFVTNWQAGALTYRGPGFTATGTANPNQFEVVAWGGATNGLLIGTDVGGAPLKLMTDNVERMRITGTGNVGIGTTAPTEALEVNGTIKATGFSGPIASATVASGAGSASSPSMTFSGDTDTGFYDTSSNDTIGVAAGGTPIFNFSSSGLVSPTTGGAAITTSNGTASAPTYSFAGDTGTGWFRPAAGTLAASTGGTEKIRIDSSGNVGIGTTIFSSRLTVNGGNIGHIMRSDTADAIYNFSRARGTDASQTAVQDGDYIGRISFYGYEGSASQPGAQIIGVVSGTPTTGSVPMALKFTTGTSSGGSTRMTILPNGKVGIGTSAPVQALDVNGTMRTSASRIMIPDGSAGLTINEDAGPSAAIKVGGIHIGGNYSGSDPVDGQIVTNSTDISIMPNGSTAMTLKQNGNIGVGTLNPSTKLEVQSTTGNDGIAAIGSSQFIKMLTNMGVGSFNGMVHAGDVGVFYGGTSAADTQNGFVIAPWANTTQGIRIDSSGKVGIGTSNPGAALSITQPAALTLAQTWTRGTSILSLDAGAGGSGGPTTFSSSVPMILTANNPSYPYQLYLNTNGNVGIGTSNPSYSMQIESASASINTSLFIHNNNPTANSGAAISFGIKTGIPSQEDAKIAAIRMDTPTVDDTDLAFSTISNQVLGEKVRITSQGKVGIGTTAPAAALDVSSHSSGFLPPRMTATERDAIASPENGMVLYNTTAQKLNLRENGAWIELSSGGGGGGGRTSCPAGFTLIGDSGSVEAYCISTNEETAATWENAATACYNKSPKAHLCSIPEWTMACISALPSNMLDGDNEWIGDAYDGAGVIAQNSCSKFNDSSLTNTNVYRCCFR
jgi:hypothetical protein